MRIVTMTAIAALALPFMALAQTTEEPQQTESTAPAKGKKMRGVQEQRRDQAKPETATDLRGQTTIKGRAHDISTNQRDAQPSTNQTNVSTSQTMKKENFRTRHSDVFSLGRHPKEFFVHRYGASHVRLIGNSYFVFVDGCWVAVDVDGFTFTERVICAGDPDFVEVGD